ncbi:Protein of unknown function [Microbulbifer thermotolerans]|uniref:Uncharacterized protein n=2 Tax=Microbulbifer thermotolerans TaxID=252514 RepID=A0A143HJM4_MICTH|nr:DUF2799 domain-containing protein [Microbulbifer thermotolerans]AMX01925.1 hypothetical protein A3224_04395 [Microbulbifer thermotolerans]WKT61462.1 DUF2799 domain-containing protein [Microbulbifer thermotolerans]SFB67241.1 Protein of unknown function [Microbulbifer thermotolerans]
MKMTAWIIPFTALILVGGCATMSEEECLTADWRAIGYEDGAAGLQIAQLSKRREACAKHGVRPDTASYRTGRDEGLQLYCTEHQGFRLGRAGGTYSGVCPADLEGLFLRGHSAGRDIYLAQSAVNQVASAISDLEREREHILDDITEMSAHLVSDEATKEERVTLLADIARLKERHTELELDIEDLEQELALREAEYQEVLARSPY